MDGMVLASLETKKFLMVNPIICEWLGYKQEEIKGLGVMDIHPKENLPYVIEQFTKQARGEIKLAKDIPVKRMDGSVFFVDINSTPLDIAGEKYLLGIFRDITERKQAEEKLRESENRLSLVVETINAVFWMTDVSIESMHYVSSGYERIWGRSVQSLYENPRTFIDAIHPEDRKRVVAELEIQKTGLPFEHEYRVVRPDGEIRWVRDRGFPICDKTGKPERYTGIAQDITERKQVEEKLQEAYKELTVSLQEKEVLLREVHHRVKNNLQVISGLIGMQKNAVEATGVTVENVKDAFQDCQSRIESMSLVHERLYQTKDFANIDFLVYLKDLAQELYSLYKKEDHISLHFEGEDIHIGINEAIPLGLAVNELISNSMKYAFPDNNHSEITVSFRSLPDGILELRVCDNGVGISDDIDWQNPHTLGLKLVNGLVAQIDGEITLNKSGGTDFVITFRKEIP